MSIPPDPSSSQPDPPPQGHDRPQNWARQRAIGGISAVAAVLVISTVLSLSGRGVPLVLAPAVALVFVICGSLLTISQSRRQFAVGFLIASAVLIFVTAGACVVAFWVSAPPGVI